MALSSYAAAHHSVKTRPNRLFNTAFVVSSLSTLTGAIAGALVMSQLVEANGWLTGSALGAAVFFATGLTGRVASIAYRQR